MRREYKIEVVINGIAINKAIIDPHYEEKHNESITDQIILTLIQKLDGQRVEPEETKSPYSYFATSGIEHDGKLYKLIWLLEENNIYIGVINAYRRTE